MPDARGGVASAIRQEDDVQSHCPSPTARSLRSIRALVVLKTRAKPSVFKKDRIAGDDVR